MNRTRPRRRRRRKIKRLNRQSSNQEISRSSYGNQFQDDITNMFDDDFQFDDIPTGSSEMVGSVMRPNRKGHGPSAAHFMPDINPRSMMRSRKQDTGPLAAHGQMMSNIHPGSERDMFHAEALEIEQRYSRRFRPPLYDQLSDDSDNEFSHSDRSRFMERKSRQEDINFGDFRVDQQFHSRSPLRDNFHSRSPLRDNFHSRSPLRDNFHSRSPLRDMFHSRSPFRDDSHSRSPLRDGFHAGSPLREDFSQPREVSVRDYHHTREYCNDEYSEIERADDYEINLIHRNRSRSPLIHETEDNIQRRTISPTMFDRCKMKTEGDLLDRQSQPLFSNEENVIRHANEQKEYRHEDSQSPHSTHSDNSEYESRIICSDPSVNNTEGLSNKGRKNIHGMFDDDKLKSLMKGGTGDIEQQLMLLLLNQMALIQEQQKFIDKIESLGGETPATTRQTLEKSDISKRSMRQVQDNQDETSDMSLDEESQILSNDNERPLLPDTHPVTLQDDILQYQAQDNVSQYQFPDDGLQYRSQLDTDNSVMPSASSVSQTLIAGSVTSFHQQALEQQHILHGSQTQYQVQAPTANYTGSAMSAVMPQAAMCSGHIQSQTVPQSLIQSQTVPQGLIQSQTVPQGLIQSRTVPQSLVQCQTVPQGLIQSQTVPQGLIQSRTVPQGLIQSQTVPQGLIQSQTEPKGLIQSRTVPPNMIVQYPESASNLSLHSTTVSSITANIPSLVPRSLPELNQRFQQQVVPPGLTNPLPIEYERPHVQQVISQADSGTKITLPSPQASMGASSDMGIPNKYVSSGLGKFSSSSDQTTVQSLKGSVKRMNITTAKDSCKSVSTNKQSFSKEMPTNTKKKGKQRSKDDFGKSKRLEEKQVKIHQSAGKTVYLKWKINPVPPVVPVLVSRVDGQTLFTVYGQRLELHKWYSDRIKFSGDTTKGLIQFAIEKVNFMDQGVYKASFLGEEFIGPCLTIQTDVKQRDTASLYWIIKHVPAGKVVKVFQKNGPLLFTACGKIAYIMEAFRHRVKFNGDTTFGLISFNLMYCSRRDTGTYMASYDGEEFEGRFLNVIPANKEDKDEVQTQNNIKDTYMRESGLMKEIQAKSASSVSQTAKVSEKIITRDCGSTAFLEWHIRPVLPPMQVTIRKKMGDALFICTGKTAMINQKYTNRITFLGDTTVGLIKFTFKELTAGDRGTYVAVYDGQNTDGPYVVVMMLIYVGNLPNNTKHSAVRKFFEDNGISVTLLDRENRHIKRGFIYVKCTAMDLERAIALDGKLIDTGFGILPITIKRTSERIHTIESADRSPETEKHERTDLKRRKDEKSRHERNSDKKQSSESDTRKNEMMERVFVGNLPKSTRFSTIKHFFKTHGITVCLMDRENRMIRRDFAYVKCHRRDLERALSLDGRQMDTNYGIVSVTIKGSGNSTTQNTDHKSSHKEKQKNEIVKIYVGNLPVLSTSNELKTFFHENGVNVRHCIKTSDMCFGFVECEACDVEKIMDLNNCIFGYKPIKIGNTKYNSNKEDVKGSVIVSNLPLPCPLTYLTDLFDQKNIPLKNIERRAMSPNAHVDLVDKADISKALTLNGAVIHCWNKQYKITVQCKEDIQYDQSAGGTASTAGQSSQNSTAALIVGNLPVPYPTTYLKDFFQKRQIDVHHIQRTSMSPYAYVVLAYQEDLNNAVLLNGEDIEWQNQYRKISVYSPGELETVCVPKLQSETSVANIRKFFQSKGIHVNHMTEDDSYHFLHLPKFDDIWKALTLMGTSDPIIGLQQVVVCLPAETLSGNKDHSTNFDNSAASCDHSELVVTSVSASTIWVGNLSTRVNSSEIRRFFQRRGIPVACAFKFEEDRFALVDLVKPSQAKQALALNGTRLAKHQLKIKLHTDCRLPKNAAIAAKEHNPYSKSRNMSVPDTKYQNQPQDFVTENELYETSYIDTC